MAKRPWKPGDPVRMFGLTLASLFVLAEDNPDLIGVGGTIDEERQVIKIDSSATPARQRINLLHELVHGSDSMTSVDTDEITEAATVRIARNLWGIFRDNPGLAEWIASGDA